MTVVVEPPGSGSPARAGSVPSGRLVIGLINNMPDSAVEGTESQFVNLLSAASSGLDVRLCFSTLPNVPRAAAAAARIAAQYWPLAQLYREPPDALIVTGTEPRAPVLADEPYWAQLIELLEFSQSHVHSSVWSCLAAHAAAQQLDGIGRQRLPVKRSGVYQHSVLRNHALTAGLSDALPTPHSRWNDLPLPKLLASGYEILSQSAETGADAFVKQGANLMVFFQGHPEYEERTLLKEFQRDVGRYVAGHQPNYPTLPDGYFSPDALGLLARFEADLRNGRLVEPMVAFPFSAVAASLVNSWRLPAARIYSNWLAHILARKQKASTPASRAL
jgi:homoserine O-succinyltransferase/O-acetyltransferase